MEAEVRARKQAEAAQRPLHARLQAATDKAVQAAGAKERAQENVQVSQAALQRAEESLTAASKAEAEAQEELKRITAEAGQTQEAGSGIPDPPPAKQVLEDLLTAVRAAAASGPEGVEAARSQLEAVAARAEATLRPPPSSDADMASGGPAAAAPTPCRRSLTADQRAKIDADRRAAAHEQAAELLKTLEATDADPEVKKARLADALNQAWGDAPFAPTQPE